jgi:5'-3' exonuclease
MGIKGLNKFLKEFGTKTEMSSYRNKTIAIDTSIYIYKYKYKSTPSQFLKRFEYQINQFHKNNIRPIYIFDGPAPIEKMKTKEKRKQAQEKGGENTIIVTKEDIKSLKDLLDQNEVGWQIAPSEGEKYCSYLNKTGKVDIAMSNDLDSLLFGCKVLLTQTTDGYIEYQLSHILENLKLDLPQLIELGISCGCDYEPVGISGFGPSKTLKKMKKDGSIKNWEGCPENLEILVGLFTNFNQEQISSNELILELSNELNNLELESIASSN